MTAAPPSTGTHDPAPDDHPFDARIVRLQRVVARVGAFASILVGAAGLLGGLLRRPTLSHLSPALQGMKAHSALGFVLAGVSLALRFDPAPRRRSAAALVCAWLVVPVGAVSFGELLAAPRDAPPGCIVVALSFCLLGAALVTFEGRWERATQWLVAPVLFLGATALLGCLFEVRELHTVASFLAVAPLTAAVFVALGVSVLFARPDKGLASILNSSASGAVTGRRYMLAAVIAPVILGWIRLQGQRAGLYSTEFGLTMLTAAQILTFTALSLWSTRAAIVAELERARLLRELAASEAQLQSQASIAQSQEKFRALVMSSPVAIFETDANDVYVFVNPRWTELTGLTLAQARSSPKASMMHPDDRERVLATRRALRSSAGIYSVEYRYLSAQGSVAWVLGSVVPLRSAAGALTGYLGTVVDVTEQRRTTDALASSEGALRASLAEKETLLREVHHRVKNNLQVIASLINLQSSKVESPAMRAILSDLRSRVHAIALLHERVYRAKDLARIDMRSYLDGLVAEAARTWADGRPIEVSARACELTLDADTALPVGLIVNELVSNAFKHAFPPDRRDGGRIDVELARRDGAVVLSVADDGIGLPKGFGRDPSDSLGLTLVTGLSGQIDGTLTIEGDGGARFEVRFAEHRPTEGEPKS